MNLIEEIIDSTKELEPPQNFWYWSMLTAIAAVVKGNVWLDRYNYILYPNIYVMLVADSGLRKSATISLVRSLVTAVGNTRVIAGRNSIEAIINNLSKAYTQENGEIIKDAVGLLVSSEFSNFIIRNPQALTILTELYDSCYNDEQPWANSLKSTGVEELHHLNISMIGASNESHLTSLLQQHDVEGGFIARTFLIHAKEKHTLNPLTIKPKRVPDKKALAARLSEIALLKGPFIWTDTAIELYNDWYVSYDKSKKRRKVADKTGTVSRYEDHILKVAMLLSLAKRTDLLITVDDIQESLDVCHEFLLTIDRLMISHGPSKNEKGEYAKSVLAEMIRAGLGGVSRIKLLQKLWAVGIGAAELDEVMDTFLQARVVKINSPHGQMHYTITEKTLAIYEQKKESA